jgi:hypothetical protein
MTPISNQIQMKKKKNQRIDQKTSSVLQAAAIVVTCAPFA